MLFSRPSIENYKILCIAVRTVNTDDIFPIWLINNPNKLIYINWLWKCTEVSNKLEHNGTIKSKVVVWNEN